MVSKIEAKPFMTRFTNKRSWSIILKQFIPIAVLFILFSALNGLLPIALCLLGSYSPMGIQTVMSIGYLAAIQLAFIQVGWAITIACIYGFGKYYNTVNISNSSSSNSIMEQTNYTSMYQLTNYITLIYSLIATPLYILSGFIYNGIALAHVNTSIGLNQGYLYLFSSCGFVLINGFICNNIIYSSLNKKYTKAFIYFFIYTIIIIACLIGGLAIHNSVSNNNYVYYSLTMGISLTIAGLISWLIIYILSYVDFKFSYFAIKNKNQLIRCMLNNSYKNIVLIIMIQIFKVIAIISIGFYFGSNTYATISMNYMIGRNVWYNILYILPFIGYGLADAILFYGIVDTRLSVSQINKLSLICVVFSIISQICFSFGFYFAIKPLINVYLMNQNLDIIINQAIIDISANPTRYQNQLQYLLEILFQKKEYSDKLVFLLKNKTLYNGFLIFIFGKNFTIANKTITPILENIVAHNVSAKEGAKQLVEQLNIIAKNDPKLLPKITNLLVKNLTEANVDSINNLFDFSYLSPDLPNSNSLVNPKLVTKHSFSYLYLSVWTIFYSSGTILNNGKMVMRNAQRTTFEFIFTLVMEAIIIGLIVGIGLGYQYTTYLPVYDAWSVVLCAAGIAAIIYYLYSFISTSKKITKVMNESNIINNVK